MSKKNKAYVVPQTHWDREWRYPLWTNRKFLVDFFDALLHTLDTDPDYTCFVTDGQCVMIEDYLLIRPEKEERIKEHVKSGRLKIGPWYTLPDLYPVDGECLVRNLSKGLRVANKYGGYLHTGYHSFGWGQTAQFPQIYDQFGFNFSIVAKRVSPERAPKCEFLWQGPDGTRIVASRLGLFARANFYVYASMPVRHDIDYAEGIYPFIYGDGRALMHNATCAHAHDDFQLIRPPHTYHEQHVKQGWQDSWDALKDTAVSDCRILLGGCDFCDHGPDLPKMLRQANEQIDDVEFVQASIDDYVEDFLQRVDENALPLVQGELRDGPPHACSANGLAARMYIKLKNKQAQQLILHRAEPLASLMALHGCEYPVSFLNIAWDYLFKSHAHDSINGCAQDKIANDTVHRLDQVLEIGKVVHEQSVVRLIEQIDFSAFDKKDVLLLVVNPTPCPVHALEKVNIDIPQEQNAWTFTFKDSDGKEYPVQHLSRIEKTKCVHDPTGRPWPFTLDQHVVYADFGEIPAGGYKVFKIEKTESFNRNQVWWAPVRKHESVGISSAPHTLENEFLKITVAPNGTLTIHDKQKGTAYKNLLYFEDGGEAGDFWVHVPPYHDQVFTSLGANARIWCEENGVLAATLGVEVTLEVPTYALKPIAGGVKGESRRSEETKLQKVVSYITLKKHWRRLEITTKFKNVIRDHRLRVLFPTGIKAETVHAAGHFTVDARPIEPVKDADGKYYPEMQTKPLQQFVDVSDGNNGFAVLNNCFTEYEMLQDEKNTLALTLCRSVKNLVCSELFAGMEFPDEEGGQCLVDMSFDYAIYLHDGDWAEGGVYQQAEELNTPCSLFQTVAHDSGSKPIEQSLFEIKPENLVLSAFKKAEDKDAYILRIFNPTDSLIEGSIRVPETVSSVCLLNLNEERQQEIVLESGNVVSISVEHGKIVTLEMEM